ncbi:hypothetical protein DID73_01300 [Candidatus Marinamargulisbacteria bacterium SCGC AG-343-K17]|nr:hypothetical protein DID73_01300 [Candidatus Marinamargulisbacteria bacterium SCGC AG-343-K17]
MSILTSLFLGTFLVLYSIFYPIFKRPVFATYVVILLIIGFCSVKLFRYLRQQTFAKTNVKQKLRLGFLWAFQGYLALMVIWYVVVHFKTYKIM